jgi:hypothetical protein
MGRVAAIGGILVLITGAVSARGADAPRAATRPGAKPSYNLATPTVPVLTDIWPVGLTDAGEVVMVTHAVGEKGQPTRLMSWNGKSMKRVPLPGLELSLRFRPLLVNNKDQMVGTAPKGNTQDIQMFFKDGDKPLEIVGMDYPSIGAMNGVGQVAVGSHDKVYLWERGKPPKDIGILGDPANHHVEARGMNDQGEIVGMAFVLAPKVPGAAQGAGRLEPFIWDEEHGMRSLGLLPDSMNGLATAINNKGTVVGVCQRSFQGGGGRYQAFIWDKKDGMRPLDAGAAAWATATPSAINDAGVVVGNGCVTESSSMRAFVFREGKMYSIGELFNDPRHDNWSMAPGINSKGQILLSSGSVGLATPN